MNTRILLYTGGVFLTATVALIVIGPDPLAGQTERSAAVTTQVADPFPASRREPNRIQANGRQISEPRRFTGPFGRRASATTPAVQQVQGTASQRESDIQRELRALYEKNGKQMPEMRMQHLPKSAPGMNSVRPRAPQQGSGAPAAAPQTKSRFGFLKKIFPFGRKTSEQKLVNPPPQYRTANQPRYRQPAYRPPQYRQQPATRTIPAQPVQSTVVRQPSIVRDPNAPPLLFSDDPNKVVPNVAKRDLAAPAFPATTRKPAAPVNEIPVLIDDRQPAPKTEVALPKQPVKTASPTENNGSFNPFPGGSEQEADNGVPAKTVAAPARETTPPVASENPFTGKKLTDDNKLPVLQNNEPAEKTVDSGPEKSPFAETEQPKTTVIEQPKTTVTDVQPETKENPPLEIRSAQEIRKAQEAEKHPLKQDVGKVTLKPDPKLQDAPKTKTKTTSKEEKMRRIAERSGMSGFRGFCPVVLRDQRELADAKPEFHATFEGKTYFLSSAAAKAAFDKQPKKYAPANAGHDVIAGVNSEVPVEGSLQNAVWFRDRLYFFSSVETLKTFVKNPKKYVAAE